MSRTSKRAQLEALGWSFAAIPRHIPVVLGWPAYTDVRSPAGWLATPPDGHPAAPRRFDNSSPNRAVRWAYEQATAPRPDPELGGVAALVAQMGAARSSGVVADAADEPGLAMPRRPDAELLSLCREAAGCDRLQATLREGAPKFYRDKAGYLAVSKRVGEAGRARHRMVPRIVEIEATTPAGLLAKAELVCTLFDTATGQRADAVRALVRDLAAVLGNPRVTA